MTNLTEYSWYYCKMNDGDIRMLERGADYFLDGDVPLLNNEVKSVLAEVPSYELWKAVHEQWEVLLEENKRLKHDVGNLGYKIKNQRKEIDNRLKENTKLKETISNDIFLIKSRDSEIVKLKELLKECKHIMSIEKDFASCHLEKDKLSKLCEQITELLGDK